MHPNLAPALMGAGIGGWFAVAAMNFGSSSSLASSLTMGGGTFVLLSGVFLQLKSQRAKGAA